jgi:DNA polymerase III epsilon subunit-like protein
MEKNTIASACCMGEQILFSIDCETTGLNHRIHELIQICILPFKNFKPLKEDAFYFQVKALHPETAEQEAFETHNLDPTEGLDRKQSIDLFYQWLKRIKAKFNIDKITPLGQDYAFDKEFIINWLDDFDLYHENFSSRYSDTKRNAVNIQRFYSPDFKTSLAEQAEYFGIKNDKHHDAYNDSLVAIKILEKQVTTFEMSTVP